MTKSPFEIAARAQDVGDLLEHIAWAETIRPALIRERENYSKLLVGATLGLPVQAETAGGVVTITREQLAGKIYGIDYILDLFEKILARGDRAIAELKSSGVTITPIERKFHA